jgi:Ca2+-binding RTX toxin-like protein
MRRALLPLAALLLAAVPLGPRPSAAFAAGTCFGKPATHVVHRGDPFYFGTADDDVVVGSAGLDVIQVESSGGSDRVCGGGGNDEIFVGAGGIADGGTGNDDMYAWYGGTARGGAGNDAIVAIYDGSRAEGGSGADFVVAQALYGTRATADGGSGDDVVVGQGIGTYTLLGGSGADRVVNQGFDSAIDCGSGTDTVTPGVATDVRRCEKVR